MAFRKTNPHSFPEAQPPEGKLNATPGKAEPFRTVRRQAANPPVTNYFASAVFHVIS
jgi:hypothetical protein